MIYTPTDIAIKQHFKTTTIQKYVVHLKRGVLNKVKKTHRQAVADYLKDVFDIERKDDTLQHAQSRAQAFNKW